MGPQSLLKALALLSLTLPALAAVEFKNDGTLKGWDSQSLDKGTKGKVEEVTDSSVSAPSALKMTQTFIKGYTGRYHAEVVHNEGYNKGDTKFYGFSFRLQPDWSFEPAQNYNLAQFIADFSSTGCDDWMPSTMVYLVGNKLSTRLKTGSVCKQKTEPLEVGTVEAGKWHRVVIQSSWKTDNTGLFKVWLDGKLTVDKSGIATTVSDPGTFSFRVGLYANGWHDDKGVLKGSQGTRSVWWDDIAIGSEEGDVGIEGGAGTGGGSGSGGSATATAGATATDAAAPEETKAGKEEDEKRRRRRRSQQQWHGRW